MPYRSLLITHHSLLLFLLAASLLQPGSIISSSNEHQAIFTEMPGLKFVHDPKVGGKYFFPEVMGSGCALFDYDNDGDLDILLISPSGNRLFRQDAPWHFTDVTKESGLENSGYGMGVAIGDYNNDGNLDVLLTNYGPDKLYRNDGNGKFSDVTAEARIKTDGWSTSAVFFDYNRDGFLDLYIARYVKLDPSVICTDRAGRKDYCGPEGYDAEPDLLFRNNGDGTFTDVSDASRISKYPRKGLGVVSADFNDDGYPDIYVASDRLPNQLWINQRDGTFQEQGLAQGVAVNALGQSEASMGVAAGDYNNDGKIDLFVTNLRDETNTLYRNTAAQGFMDETAASEIGGPSLPFTGFGAGFFDYDNDGNLDVAIANGRVTRGPLLVSNRPAAYWQNYAEPNLLFHNEGNGRFRDVSKEGGSFTAEIDNSRGLAFGDIDNDGDIDLLLLNCGGPARIYRNDLHSKAHWLEIRAYDPQLKRDAIGAKLTVDLGGRQITRIVSPGYSYLSSSDFRVHFGLGDATSVQQIVVQWPDGSREVFPGMTADRIVTIRKGSSK